LDKPSCIDSVFAVAVKPEQAFFQAANPQRPILVLDNAHDIDTVQALRIGAVMHVVREL
jgi:hypothetical protein